MRSQVGLRNITMNKASGGDGIPVELFQILKDDAVKVLHSICSKFGKFSCGHRTGKGQFSFQFQRKARPKNAQITAQLHSSHTLVKWCLKFSKPGFSNTWTVNFQMFKLVLERQRNKRSNCQHALDHGKSKRVPEKHLFLLYWLGQSLWLCGSQ